MREIKFRGKRLDNGEWVYGDLLRRSGATYIVYEDKPKDHNLRNIVIDRDNNPSCPPVTDWTIYELVDPETVGQYTGLDVSFGGGKEIYEGDIVTGEYFKGRVKWGSKSIVCFDTIDDTDGWNNGVILGWVTTNESSLQDLVEGGCEIIGNKYDNPELLEDK